MSHLIVINENLSLENFENDLKACNGEDVIIQITSNGQSVKEAVLISGIIKSYPGKITAYCGILGN